MRIHALVPAVLLCLVSLSGCVSFSEPQVDVQDDLARGKIGNALELLERATEVDPVLKLLEKAQLEHYGGRWEVSNATFDEAERSALDLYESSLEPDGPAMITNDVGLPYRVRPFEMAMIPYYKVFNDLALGDLGGARREAGKANLLLETATDIAFRKAAGDTLQSVAILRRSGLAHYLAGLLSESDGALDEAFVEYRLAHADFHELWAAMRVPVPVWLGDDLLRVGEALGYRTELEELERDYPGLLALGSPPGGPSDDLGTLALFVEVGWVASLDEGVISVPILETDDLTDIPRFAEEAAARFKPGWSSAAEVETVLLVTLPTIVQHWAGAPTRVELEIEGNGVSVSASSAVVEDLDQRAGLTFLGRMPTVVRLTLEKALGDYVSADGQGHRSSSSKRSSFRSETAAEAVDTRSWATLPKVLTLTRIDLPAGVYDVVVEYRDDWGTIISRERLDDVEITAGEFSFFNRRVF